MKNSFTLFILVISNIAFSQLKNDRRIFDVTRGTIENFTGIEQKFYADGKLLYWRELLEGKNSGLWLEYYPDGILRFKAQWKADKGHGKWEYFYENGKLRSLGVYENDLPIGLHYEYFPNGNIKSETTYIAGKRNGTRKIFNEIGIEVNSKSYLNDVEILDKPVLFAEDIISTSDNDEWCISFEPDGKTLYFDRRNKGEQQQKIYKSILLNGSWKKPELVDFSTDTDEAPFVTVDGKRIYFASFRKLPYQKIQGFQDMNIWYAEKSLGGWSKPKPLKQNINKFKIKEDNWPANYETAPITDVNGNLFYWTKATNSNDGNLFTAQINSDGNFDNPKELETPINHKGFDSNPIISPDGNYLFFSSSDRSGGFGNEDIFYSKLINDKWSQPENLSTIVNTMANEIYPRFSPDGKYFFFSSDRNGANAKNGEKTFSIYYMETQYLIIK